MRSLALGLLLLLPRLVYAAPDVLVAETMGNLSTEKLGTISTMLQATAARQLGTQSAGVVRLKELGGSCRDARCYQREAQDRDIPFVLMSDVVQMQGLFILNVELREASGQSVSKAVLQGGGVGGLEKAAATELGALLGRVETSRPEPQAEDIFGFDDVGAEAPDIEMTDEEKAALKREKELEARAIKEKKVIERRARQDALQEAAEGASPLKAPPGGIVLGPGIILNTGNPMVSGKGIGLDVHIKPTQQMGILASATYIPDLGASDLKGLTSTLVQIAHDGSGNVEFQQPLDKINAILYGSGTYSLLKNNQNGDIYGNLFVGAGLGLISSKGFYAKYDDSAADGSTPVQIVEAGSTIQIPLVFNIGMDRWPTNKLGYRILMTNLFGYQLEPQYDPDVPTTDSYVAHNVLASLQLLFSKGK
jgi:hypothetical protein